MNPLPQSSNARDQQSNELRQTFCHELAAVQEHWWVFLILGIGLAVLGTVALASAPFVTLAAVALFGIVMVVGGIAQVVSGFWAGRWSGFLLHMLLGVLYVIVGYILVDRPVEAAGGLTLLIAAFLIVAGIVRIVVAMSERFPDWGWSLLNGIVTLLLGLLIYRGWPISGLLAIGLFIGIEMIFNGWFWIMLAFSLRRSPPPECDEQG